MTIGFVAAMKPERSVSRHLPVMISVIVPLGLTAHASLRWPGSGSSGWHGKNAHTGEPSVVE
jgi:hypothetical protein